MNNNGILVNDDMLWDYADNLLSAAEKAQVEAYLTQHPELRQRLDHIQADRKALMAMPMDSPRPGFADKVMAAWVSEQVHIRSTKSTDKRLLLFPVLMGGLLAASVIGVIFAAVSSDVTVSQPTVLQQNLPAVSTETYMNLLLNPVTQMVLFAGLLLSFFGLLDRYLRLRFQPVKN